MVKTIPAKLRTPVAYVVVCKPFFVSAISAVSAVPRAARGVAFLGEASLVKE